ncbi:MAG: YfcC family protein [Eggerthellaceae bacterium]|nr:YfcC family protein [Eggerthellaceae bacterium]
MAADTEKKQKKKKKGSISSFSILLIILVVLAIITIIMGVSGVEGIQAATIADITTAPVLGFADALPVCLFVLILGGFLGIVTETGALDAGIAALVRALHGNELILIPILMFIFSIGGTTYGMCEETVPFYLLLAATMVAAGFDSLTGAAVVLLGAGCGVLGSTVNPFAVGVAVDALSGVGIEVNQGIILSLGVILWLVTLAISIFFVMRYAKKVKADKGSTILSLQEQEIMMAEWGMQESTEEEESNDTKALPKMTTRQVWVLIVFAITFVIMIASFIPWADFGVTIFEGWSAFLTGLPIGDWYFDEASTWFIIMALIIGVVGGVSESNFVKSFINGAADMMSVVLIIALARSITILMSETGLDVWILDNAANALQGVTAIVFAPLSFLLYVLLSFLIPSSSGMATVSMPIMGGLAYELNFSVETMVMIFSAGNGLVNLFTPTCGAIMGGLALARIEYTTWLKFCIKLIIILAIVCIIILTAAMLIL